MSMRKITFSLLAVSGLGLALFGAAPAHAVGTLHPFCIQGNQYPGLSNCTFDSYAQCQASASGRFLTCIANPFFAGRSYDPYAYPSHFRAPPRRYYPYLAR